MKKILVLSVLFLVPIIAYLFFASGVHNFAKLPVLTNEVKDVSGLETFQDSIVTFQDKITVVGFFGSNLEAIKGNTFNLDQKILKKYYEFHDFQFVVVVPESARPQVNKFVAEFEEVTNTQYWNFVYGTPEQVQEVFESLQTNLVLDQSLHTPFVFVVDKEKKLRGRSEDQKDGALYGYDSRSVFELGSKMNDDVKIILAEYRLATKKNYPTKKRRL